jgi:hypothetical protein
MLDHVLSVVDPELYKKLLNLQPKLISILYAFSFVKTMSASASPLSEVIKLWDVQLAIGPMFNLCCVAAQIILLKDKIMSSSFPKSILDYRNWPTLDSKKVIVDGFGVLERIITTPDKKLPIKDMLLKLQLHPSNTEYVRELAARSPHKE